jgi:pimeloyl-ACP methyl ester carboxylesterase
MSEEPSRVGEFVDVGGVRVFYRSAGSGEPIILLHGFPTSSYDWREVIGPFSGFGRVLAPDIYGHGYSGMPKGGNLLGFLPGFLSALSIENFNFVGYDAGGYIGLAYAVANPTRVDKLVIMNAPAYPNWIGHARTSPSYAPLRRMMTNPPYRWLGLAMLNKSLVQRLLTAPSGSPMPPEDLALQLQFFRRGMKGLVQMRPRPYTEPFFKAMEGAMAWLAQGLQHLTMPTVLIFGRDDPYIPDDTPGRLHEDIKGSTLHLLDRTGHFLMEQRPKEIASLISPFLSG